MDSLGNILYLCTLLHIIFEHLHNLYTLNSLSGLKGLKKFIPRDSFNSSLYILFSMFTNQCDFFGKHFENLEYVQDLFNYFILTFTFIKNV